MDKKPYKPSWEWEVMDESAVALVPVGADVENAVMIVTRCESCQERNPDWSSDEFLCRAPDQEHRRLIAATPDLLAALIAAMDFIEAETAGRGAAWKLLQEMNPKAVIAEALG